jgi:hypothetical protein
MKLIIIIFSILFSGLSLGQDWHLQNVDKTKEYSYEYWFHLDNIDDTSSFEIIKLTGVQKSTIEVRDNHNDTIMLANIRIKAVETDSVTNLISNFDGEVRFNLTKGQYKLQISATGYDSIELEFEIEKDQYIMFKVNLGLGSETIVYQINSKPELTEDQIMQIIDCVKSNRGLFLEKCSLENKYLITMHL